MSTAKTKLLAECASPREALVELCPCLEGFDPSLIDCEEVTPEEMPSPARFLLVHTEHMTKTLQAHYDVLVDLHVAETHTEEDYYTRKIMLSLEETDRMVEYGVVRLDLRYINEKVKQAILQKHAPLGSILINHNVHRHIQPRWYLKFPKNSRILEWFNCQVPGPLYGRMGTIYCDGEPCIELLEIVTAIPNNKAS